MTDSPSTGGEGTAKETARERVALPLSPDLPALAIIRRVFEAADPPFSVTTGPDLWEAHATGQVSGRPNRARLMIFAPKAKLLVAFFYKRSNLPFSTDRFSYGAVTFEPGEIDAAWVASWVTYLQSGLAWEMQPEGLKKAFPYTVPV